MPLRRMLERAEQEELPGDVIIVAMLVTDGRFQTKYVDSFEWSLEAVYWNDLLKALLEEMETNGIYACMQRATVASIVALASQSHHNAGSIIAGQCVGSQYWDIPGRWRRVFGIMLNVKSIRQNILGWNTYDKELLGVMKEAEFADLFCEHILKFDPVTERNREFMRLRITN